MSEDSTYSWGSDGIKNEPNDTVISNSETLNNFGRASKTLRRLSSSTRSPTSGDYGQGVPAHKKHTSVIQDPVLAMCTDGMHEYEETYPQPFRSIGESLDPFRTMSQDHPRISVEELKFHCGHYHVLERRHLLTLFRFPCVRHKSNGTVLDSHFNQVAARFSQYTLHRFCAP